MKTRVIVLNYPSNPSGAYPSAGNSQKLHEFAATHKLWVISDEVCENLYSTRGLRLPQLHGMQIPVEGIEDGQENYT